MACYIQCYELDKSHRKSCLEIFSQCIVKQDYKILLTILETLNSTTDEELKKDNNLYLYLLNMISECPEEYIESVKNMTHIDLLLSEGHEKENEVRTNIIKNELHRASKKLLKGLIDGVIPNTIENKILQKLLTIAIKYRQQEEAKIIELVNDEKYSEAITIYEQKNQKQLLRKTDTYALLLLKALAEIKETREIPIPDVTNTKSIWMAIMNSDFERVIVLHHKKTKKYNIEKSKDIINVLLMKVKELISQIRKEELDKQKEIETANELIKLTFDSILELFKGNIENAIQLLNKYLKLIGKEEYQHLITGLIKISVYEGDNDFITPITVLSEIDEGIYNFELSLFVGEFYSNLANGKLEISEIYLDIIKTYSKDTPNIILDLTSSLETKQKSIIHLDNQYDNSKGNVQAPKSPVKVKSPQ